MQFLTLDDIEFDHETALVRVDLNVPVKDEKVSDDSRIQSLLPTIRYLLSKKTKIVLMSHFGRPSGVDASLSLEFLVPVLEKAFDFKVGFIAECIGDTVKKSLKEAAYPSITLLENLRFYEGEEKK